MTAYHVEKITSDTYRIDERGYSNCYLLAGSKRALLIDTCGGRGNLDKLVAKLTDKPVEVVLTHRHPDHAGGVHWFQHYYAGERDCNKLNSFMSSKITCRAFAAFSRVKNMRTRSFPCESKCIPIQEGHIFHLGDRDITAICTPGHTAGSISLVDVQNKMIFTGDEVGIGIWLWLPDTLPIRDWMVGAKRIRGFIAEGYRGFTGHGDGSVKLQDIDTLITTGNQLMRDYHEGKITKNIILYPKAGSVQILCRKKNNV